MAKGNSKPRNLTDAFCRNVKHSGGRYPDSYRDATVRGLTFLVHPGGSKVWMTRYKAENGNSLPKKLGSFPKMGVAKARKEKLAFLPKKKKAESPPNNGQELADKFYKYRVNKAKRAEGTLLNDQSVIKNDILPVIGKMHLNAIDKSDAAEIISSTAKTAPVWAMRTFSLMKEMFQYAVTNNWMDSNPAADIDPKFLGVEKPTIGERALDVDPEGNPMPEKKEIRIFWNAMETVPRLSPQISHGLRILMLTGVRSGELRVARWKNVSLDAGTWFIPAGDTKTGKAWTVPLSDLAVEQFRRLKDLDREWVLPSIRGEGCLTDKAMARALKRMFSPKGGNDPALDIESFTPHDLRRTLRTHLGALGVAPHIAEKCLNHSLGRISKTYDKNTYLPERREALQKWADQIDLAIHDRDNVKVLARGNA